MASDTPYWQLEKEYYTLTTDADMVLRVVEHSSFTRTENGFPLTVKAPCKVHEFKVNRATLCAHSVYFKQLLNRVPTTYAESTSDQNVVDVHEEDGGQSVLALNTWFKIFHKTVTPDTYEMPIDCIWSMLSVAAKYGMPTNGDTATLWFEAWYNFQPQVKKFGYRDYTGLLYPCYMFNFSRGFMQSTKYLVYHSNQGTITENQPPNFFHHPPMNASSLHMPQHIMQQLNAAKGRLKIILHRSLYLPIDKLLREAKCACAPNVLYAYERSLLATGIWPLESKWQTCSISTAVQELHQYSGAEAKVETCGSQACTFSFEEMIRSAQDETLHYFDGLCLDCMSTSNTEGAKPDADYWVHAQPGYNWDHRCREKHNQPSWYFSFMGRRQKMQDWTKAPKAKKEGGRRTDGAPQGQGGQNGDQQQIGGNQAEAPANGMRFSYGGHHRGGSFPNQQQYSGYHQNGGGFGQRGPQRGFREDFFATSRYGGRRGVMNNGGYGRPGGRYTSGPSDARYSETPVCEANVNSSTPDSDAAQPEDTKTTFPSKKDSPQARDSDAPGKETSVPEAQTQVTELSIKEDGVKKNEIKEDDSNEAKVTGDVGNKGTEKEDVPSATEKEA